MHFSTNRLEIRHPTIADKQKLMLEIGKWDVAKYLTHVPYPYADEDADKWIQMCKENKLQSNIYLDGSLMGGIGLTKKNDDLYELGYWIAKSFWGKGYASEAVQGLLHYIAYKKSSITIEANYFVDNIASAKVLEKVGFNVTVKGACIVFQMQRKYPVFI
jgi:RimJ/RimL family protein N-acetyltransferase